ncbi:multiple sugar transport system substrate-binding protein [Streptoalloteichus tenebrarius]|uniref:Multiple sugar transport system substrate-binding protein n=1 Tax=Streptoalloteichus tenebrarius (strain ATCC 17920 / DSM 40477 / JCM 4838 / CBS 697.72 / NBRC 16177 / NCIMB 11028 / NRRL B-12390 / A12253. 1 / ISP 5477) TaxID=1933 RepID=A0ABT1I323_STRSD|nr:extracellular solute-binding protein [Streptoalloteichus tenebrarius]MCP2262172.1 multiple sugar transport system substrate-binding protein [Streptoalloteichus tenebrarius]BFF00025.1 extracellular solute-binding protein [Streptoalloteichus tenebrarius]
MRTRGALPLLVALLLVLAGCGGLGADRAEARTGFADEPVGPLTTMGYSLPDEVARVRVERFRQRYPAVDLRLNEGAFDEQQFLSALASGRPPDLVYLDRADLPSFAARGALLPLDECFEVTGMDLAEFRPAAAAQVRYQNRPYGVPEFLIVRLLMANRVALADAGIDPSRVDTADWGRLEAWARAMTRSSGSRLARLGVDPKIPDFFPMWVRAAGGDVLSADGRTARLDSPQAVEVLEMAKRIVDQAGGQGVVQAFRDGWDLFGARNPFAADQIGLSPMEDWYLNVLAQNSPRAPVVVLPFVGRDHQPLSWATGLAWAIPQGARNRAAACRLVREMTTPDAWVAAATAKRDARLARGLHYTGTYTAHVAADERIRAEVLRPTGLDWLDEGIRVIERAQGVAFALPASPAGAEVKRAWEDAVTRALGGRASPADALREAQQRATAALARVGAR